MRPFKPSEAICNTHRAHTHRIRQSRVPFTERVSRLFVSSRFARLGLSSHPRPIAYLGALRAADERLADVTHGEHARGLDIVPILLRERIDTAREGKTHEKSSIVSHAAPKPHARAFPFLPIRPSRRPPRSIAPSSRRHKNTQNIPPAVSRTARRRRRHRIATARFRRHRTRDRSKP